MADDMQMGGGAMADEDQMAPSGQYAQTPQQNEDEPVSVFLSKASLPPGKKYQKGDRIELEVLDVDSETGDLESCICDDSEGNNHEQYGESPSLKGFDEAMPESE